MAENPNSLVRPWLSERPWDVVVFLNEDLCRAGHAQHGQTSDGYEKARSLWEEGHARPMSLEEAVELCFQVHRLGPFLNFNGNTMAAIARQATHHVVASLDPLSAHTFLSAVGHYVAGTITKSQFQEVLLETTKKIQA